MSARSDDRARELGQLLQHAALGRVPVDQDEAELARLLDRFSDLEREQRPRSRRLWYALAAAAVLGMIALGFGLRSRDLTYTVLSPSSPSDQHATAAKAPLGLLFSDGSQVALEPGANLRVDETRAGGATIVLERGAASTHVVHRKDSHWQIVAGPYRVRVVGTRLRTDWDPAAQTLEVSVQEGAVSVESATGARVELRAGQWLRANATTQSQHIGAASARRPPEPAPPEPISPPTSAAKPQPQPAPIGKQEPPRRAAPSLAELLAGGDFEGVVATAEALGVERCLASCANTDLRALADAARYTGRRNLAERALLAMRKSAGSAQLAAFLLGRHHESSRPAEALRWYEVYLVESGGGSYASEALAGKIRTLEATRGKAAAAGAAREYLQRFPRGIHEKTARRVLGTGE